MQLRKSKKPIRINKAYNSWGHNSYMNHDWVVENPVAPLIARIDHIPVQCDHEYNVTRTSLSTLEGSPLLCKTFGIHNQNITSLLGLPMCVYKDFAIYHTNATSLKESPMLYAGKVFIGRSTPFTSFEGCPLFVNGDFWCDSNSRDITSLVGMPLVVMGGCTLTLKNLKSLEGMPRYIHGHLHLTYPAEYGNSAQIRKKLAAQGCTIRGRIYLSVPESWSL